MFNVLERLGTTGIEILYPLLYKERLFIYSTIYIKGPSLVVSHFLIDQTKEREINGPFLH